MFAKTSTLLTAVAALLISATPALAQTFNNRGQGSRESLHKFFENSQAQKPSRSRGLSQKERARGAYNFPLRYRHGPTYPPGPLADGDGRPLLGSPYYRDYGDYIPFIYAEDEYRPRDYNSLDD